MRAYQAEAARKSDFERTELAKDKTGVRLDGVQGINPVNGPEIPIFISDYVLATYGTGAIMAVPAHDTRDYDFARAFGLPIVEVVAGGDVEKEAFTDCATGVMVNSGFLTGMTVDQAKKAITAWLEENGKGHKPRSTTSCATGCSAASATGASPSPWSTAPTAAGSPCPRASLPLTPARHRRL